MILGQTIHVGIGTEDFPTNVLERNYPHFYRLFGWRPEDKEFSSSIHEEGTLAAMSLVCSTPNLADLEVAGGCLGDTNFLLNKVDNGQVIGPKFTLSFLDTLIAYTHFPTLYLPDLNGLLHSAPNLTTLILGRPSKGGSLSARLPQLTWLELRDMYMTARDLERLVCGSTRLAVVSLASACGGRIGSLPVSPRRALDALVPARLALRSLALLPRCPRTVTVTTLTTLNRLSIRAKRSRCLTGYVLRICSPRWNRYRSMPAQ
ncbi:hypothetical protein F5144DRAFT_565948 [Chaetomium tenue]|uniref:Uncharacterized protein n=1 Tax=Chaetomium tenue TaxID=1854479 RepID=A0ACB7PA83_9PEZI|nr:hypothetical protein F5144DRAFT_565948 [Chaetomium globosum]